MIQGDGRRMSKPRPTPLTGRLVRRRSDDIDVPENTLSRRRELRFSAAINPACDRKARKSSASSHTSEFSSSADGDSDPVVSTGNGRRCRLGGVGAGRGFSKYGRELGFDGLFVRSMGRKSVVRESPFGDDIGISAGDILRGVPRVQSLADKSLNTGDDLVSEADESRTSRKVYDFIPVGARGRRSTFKYGERPIGHFCGVGNSDLSAGLSEAR
jgi:hypothetical protein